MTNYDPKLMNVEHVVVIDRLKSWPFDGRYFKTDDFNYWYDGKCYDIMMKPKKPKKTFTCGVYDYMMWYIFQRDLFGNNHKHVPSLFQFILYKIRGES